MSSLWSVVHPCHDQQDGFCDFCASLPQSCYAFYCYCYSLSLSLIRWWALALGTFVSSHILRTRYLQLDLKSGTICWRTSDCRTCHITVSDSRCDRNAVWIPLICALEIPFTYLTLCTGGENVPPVYMYKNSPVYVGYVFFCVNNSSGRFGVAVTAFVTSTKLCYVEPG